MKVRVTKEGFMFGAMQKVGAVITLEKDKHFSKNWMEKIEDDETDEAVEIETEMPEKEPESKEKPKRSAPKKKSGKAKN